MLSDRLVLAGSVLLATLGGPGCSQAPSAEPIGTAQQDLCDDHNPCTRDLTLPGGRCHFVPAGAGTPCDDGSVCTTNDRCTGHGQCRGTAVVCNDGNPCTYDRCDPIKGCGFPDAPAGTRCNDGSVCTTADHCDGQGACVGGALDCDDANPCTVDTCRVLTGCIHQNAPATTACDDGSACTENDHCNGRGTCVRGTRVSCDDSNPCTGDRCNPATGCEHGNRPSGFPCSDNSVCTTGDRCDGHGECVGASVSCNDSNPCTDDGCDSVAGCKHPPSPPSTACDDSNACTSYDHCDGAGVCVGGAPVVCDDSNHCTDDSCDPATGCVFVPWVVATACEDGNGCTLDRCDPAIGCVHPPVAATAACDDANACTTSDHCDGAGTCVGGGTLVCADDNWCTTDACDPGSGCVHGAVSCDDANACTTDSCVVSSGCQHVAVPVEDDDNPCTVDACDPAVGIIHQAAGRGTSCSDGDPSNGDELCDGAGHCQPGVSAEPVSSYDSNALERIIDGRHPVAASADAFAVVFSEPVHDDGAPPRIGVAVRSAVGELRGVAWIDGVTMTPHASVAALSDGSFAVVYESRAVGIEPDGLEIGAVRVSPQGAVLGVAGRVNETTAYSQHSPDIVATSTGALVAWEDESQDGMRRICWRYLDSNAAAVGKDKCDSQAGAWDGFVTLAALGTHTAMAWQREANAEGTLEVWVDGKRAAFPLSTDAGPLPAGEAPGLTALGPDTLLVAYANGDGVTVGAVLDDLALQLDAVELASASDTRQQLALAGTTAGACLAWKQPAKQAGGAWDPHLDEVYVQELQWSAGVLEPAGSGPRPIPRTEADRAGDQARPGLAPIAVTTGGALVIVWQDLQSHLPGRCPHGDVLVSLEPLPIP